jgi:thiopurine S-methyltransferase
MQAEFWQQRWEAGQIGFHQPEANSFLRQYWPTLALNKGARVLVPLCGKSLDMTWLAAQGFAVVGVELSQKAVVSYFAEHDLKPEVRQQGVFTVYHADGVEIWCGDFFALDAEDIGRCDALYDRAALIALPEPMRERYARHIGNLTAEGCTGLLVTLDYDQSKMDGPPFAVSSPWVREYLGREWNIVDLATADALSSTPRAVQNGVTRVEERVYRLTRKG